MSIDHPLLIEAISREIVLKNMNLVKHLLDKIPDVGKLSREIIEQTLQKHSNLHTLDLFALFHLLSRQMFRSMMKDEQFREIVEQLLSSTAKESMANISSHIAEEKLASQWNKAFKKASFNDAEKREVVVEVDEKTINNLPCPLCDKPLKECKCNDDNL